MSVFRRFLLVPAAGWLVGGAVPRTVRPLQQRGGNPHPLPHLQSRGRQVSYLVHESALLHGITDFNSMPFLLWQKKLLMFFCFLSHTILLPRQHFIQLKILDFSSQRLWVHRLKCSTCSNGKSTLECEFKAKIEILLWVERKSASLWKKLDRSYRATFFSTAHDWCDQPGFDSHAP